MADKFDPYRHEQGYKYWKGGGCKLDGVSEANTKLILRFLADMEIGANVSPSSKKGSRGFGRLRNLKSKLQTITILLQNELQIESIAELEKRELDILKFYTRMREGAFKCRKNGGHPIKAVGTYVRVFKTFWHWYQRAERKQGTQIIDITGDLDARDEKPHFNYFTIEGLKKLCDEAPYDYKVMMMFMFDSGIRSPTELMNIRPTDLEWDNKSNHYILTIRQETSKTFGRRLKLMLCSDVLREFLSKKNFKPDDYIFKREPHIVNQFLKKIGYKTLKLGDGEEQTFKERKYVVIKNGLSMYDFRHSAACYWLPRYKSESALKYRFGWKKSDMIHYYTEMLGMKDTIQEEDMYLDISKNELETQIQNKGKEITLLQEQLTQQDTKMKEQEEKMKEILDILHALHLEKAIAIETLR